jgi:hypothetical protein
LKIYAIWQPCLWRFLQRKVPFSRRKKSGAGKNSGKGQIHASYETADDVIAYVRPPLWANADESRVAGCFLLQYTRTEKGYQMTIKYTKWPQNIQNGHKIYQMATKYTKSNSSQILHQKATKYNIFRCKSLGNEHK